MVERPRSTVVVGCLLALHLLLAYWSPFCVWGGDLLAFCPEWTRGLFLVAGGLLLIPHSRQGMLNRMARIFAPLDLWGASWRSSLFRVLLLLAGTAAFIGLRSAIHLLGDGYLCLRELPESVSRSGRTGNEPLALWMLKMLHRWGGPVWHSVEFTHRLYSYASGVFYLLLSLSVARTLGRDRQEKTIILGFLLTPGYMQVFCGYVENYPLLFPAMLLYLLAGLRALRGRLPLWAPACLLGVLIPLHFTTVTLVPSLCLLAFLHIRARREPAQQGGPLAEAQKSKRARPGKASRHEDKDAKSLNQPPRGAEILRPLVALSLTPALVLILFWAVDFNPFTYARNLRGTHFLPLLAQPDFLQQYRLFAPAHLLDFLNEHLLVAPSALLALCAFRRGKSPRRPDRLFLLSAALFPLLFTFVANPEIGAFRDWDVLSLPALPLTLWAALALLDQVQEKTQRLHAGFLICGAAALHTLVWIGLNASPASAEARYVRILERGGLSSHARSYGWEELGAYYRDRRQPEQALRAYERMLEASPENPRQWNLIGVQYAKLGHPKEALQAFQRALQINPNLADAHSNVGNLYSDWGQHQTAIDHFQKAIELRPDMVEAYVNAGNAYYSSGQYEKAISHYQKVVALRPDFAEVYHNMGSAYFRSGQIDQARRCFRRVLEINPNYSRASTIRKWLQANP